MSKRINSEASFDLMVLSTLITLLIPMLVVVGLAMYEQHSTQAVVAAPAPVQAECYQQPEAGELATLQTMRFCD